MPTKEGRKATESEAKCRKGYEEEKMDSRSARKKRVEELMAKRFGEGLYL
jgi:hypothetical protein